MKFNQNYAKKINIWILNKVANLRLSATTKEDTTRCLVGRSNQEHVISIFHVCCNMIMSRWTFLESEKKNKAKGLLSGNYNNHFGCRKRLEVCFQASDWICPCSTLSKTCGDLLRITMLSWIFFYQPFFFKGSKPAFWNTIFWPLLEIFLVVKIIRKDVHYRLNKHERR